MQAEKLLFLTLGSEIPKKLFSDFPTLEHLIINNQEVINVFKFPENGNKLKILDLDQNLIQEIKADTFINLKVLETLTLTGNEIISVDENSFVGLENLKSLSLNKNKIQKLKKNTLKPLKNLRNLDLGFNLLSNVEIFLVPGRIPFLEKLNLRHNQLKETTFCNKGNLPNLKELTLSNNQIKTASLRYCPASTVVLNNNLMDSLQLSSVKNLFVLGNPIKSVVIYNCQGYELINNIKYSINFDNVDLIRFLEHKMQPNSGSDVYKKFERVTSYLMVSDIISIKQWTAEWQAHEIDVEEFIGLNFRRTSI